MKSFLHGVLLLFLTGVCSMIITSCSPSPSHSKITPKKKSTADIHSPGSQGKKSILPNGLTIITLEDHSAPVASVQVWAKTGSIHEDSRMGAGLSHILEHMLFKGTDKRGVADISRQVEAHGGYINAYTTWERTVYHIDIPSEGGHPGSSKGTEMAIDILADAMMNSTLPPKEYQLEQEVILREISMNRDDPDRQAFLLLFSTAYGQHPSRHPVIGYEEVYRALTREDVMKYYKERYVPNNLVFVVTGDIQTEKVEAQIKSLMGNWKRKALPPVFIPDEPIQVIPHVVRDESRTATEHSRISMAHQTCDFRNPDSAPLEILAMVAGNGMSSRLYQSLREKQKLVHEIDAWSHTPAWRGILAVNATCDPDKVEAVQKSIIQELERFQTTLISRQELNKTLKMAVSSHLSSRKTMSGMAADLASSELMTGDLSFSDSYLELLKKVTPEDVRRVARHYFTPSRRTITVLSPKGKSPTTAVKTESLTEKPIQKEVLPHGLILLTKEDHRLPFVEVRLTMKSGLLFEKAENNGISQLASRMLLKGTTSRNARKLVEEIESVGGSISPYSGSNSMGISIEVMQSDLPLAMEILADILKNSTFDEKLLEREKEVQIAAIHQEQEQPKNVAVLKAKARLFGSHPYSMSALGTEKTVKTLTRSEVLAFWKQIATPSNMVLAVFGDQKPTETSALVKKQLGSLPQLKTPTSKNPAAAFGKADRVISNEDKEQAVVVIAYPGIDVKNPDRPALAVMESALSGMGSRLFLRLRDQLALCYYVGVSNFIGLEPGSLFFYIGTDPKRMEEAEKEMLGEINKFLKQGLDAEELDRAKKGLVGERKMARQNLGDLALSAALDELYGLGYDHSDRLEKAYEAVTSQQVLDAARKYLSQPSVTSVVKPK